MAARNSALSRRDRRAGAGRLVQVCGVAWILAGCCGECVPEPARVGFALDAPLCSSVLPVAFFIDSLPVGADTFRVNLGPQHLRSSDYPVSPGSHRVGARIDGGFGTGYAWPDTLVTLAAGELFTDTLPFYCS